MTRAKVKGTGRAEPSGRMVTSTPWRAWSRRSLTQGSTAPNLGTPAGRCTKPRCSGGKGKIKVVPGFEDAVEEVLRAIPRGEVMTYGEVAAEAGYPGAARAAAPCCRGREAPCRGGASWPPTGASSPVTNPSTPSDSEPKASRCSTAGECAWPGRDRPGTACGRGGRRPADLCLRRGANVRGPRAQGIDVLRSPRRAPSIDELWLDYNLGRGDTGSLVVAWLVNHARRDVRRRLARDVHSSDPASRRMMVALAEPATTSGSPLGPRAPAPSSADPRRPTERRAGFAPLWRRRTRPWSRWARGDHPPPVRSQCRSHRARAAGEHAPFLPSWPQQVAPRGRRRARDVDAYSRRYRPPAAAAPMPEGVPAARPADDPAALHRPPAAVVHAARFRRPPAAHVGHQHGPALRRGIGLRLRPDVRGRPALDRRRRCRHLPPRDAVAAARRGGLPYPSSACRPRSSGRSRRRATTGARWRPTTPSTGADGHRLDARRPRRRRSRPHGHGPPPRGVGAVHLDVNGVQSPTSPTPTASTGSSRPAPSRGGRTSSTAAHHRRGPPGQGRRRRVRRALAPLGRRGGTAA